MFPMMMHDWIDVLERIGYRVEIDNSDEATPKIIVKNAYPQDIFATLSLTQPIYKRYWGHTNYFCPVLTELGIVYFDVEPLWYHKTQKPDTRIYLPNVSETIQRSALEQYKAKKLWKNLVA